MEMQYETKDNKENNWKNDLSEGCGCLLILLALCIAFNFSRILDLIEKIFCNH